MPKISQDKDNPIEIGLLGASFDTGNMGVNALGESAIKCILHRWPDAKITLLDSDSQDGEHHLEIAGKDICLRQMPVRFCKNIFLENHFLVLSFYAVLLKVFRFGKFKRFCQRRNESLDCMTRMRVIADITGGDSFSDIYGMRRFTLGFLRKWLVMFFNKDLVMLPQTYGPFKGKIAKMMARYILRKASVIYSRDKAGIKCVNDLLGDSQKGKVRFSPDMAFVLDSRKPANFDTTLLNKMNGKTVVGLNVSGLLYNEGYNRENIFNLKVDYCEIVSKIIDRLMLLDNVVVMLIPHVFPASKDEFESDPSACLKVYKSCHENTDRVILLEGDYDHKEIKYMIGLCDFVIGARMHACIAALSQQIPAVGIAYSDKFHGVFESIGVSDCVVDARCCTQDEMLSQIDRLFQRMKGINEELKESLPVVKTKILNIFENIEL